MMKCPEESCITKNWTDTDKPLLSIVCITYNHARYLDEAMYGVLSQKTNFPFEIIIHDDASTDGTSNLVRKYYDQYPLIVRPVIQSVNQYSQGNKPSMIVSGMCRGKYVAVCEGDDYWVDPEKLQKQVDFLENNPEYVISGHDAKVIDDQGNLLEESKLPDVYKRDFNSESLILGNVRILTLSWVYRNGVCPVPPERANVVNGDNFIISLLGNAGKSKYHSDIMPAVYRVHSGGVWSLLSAQKRRRIKANTYYWLSHYYSRIGEKYYADHFWKKFVTLGVKELSVSELLREIISRCLEKLHLKTFFSRVLRIF